MILLCKGTYAPVAHPFKGQGDNAPLFRRPCMRNCGVTKNVVCRCSCRYTVYHTEKNNHLKQTIGIIFHKRSILATIILQNVMFLKKNRNYHETIYDGPIDMKETLE